LIQKVDLQLSIDLTMFQIALPTFAEIGAILKVIVERKNIRRYTKNMEAPLNHTDESVDSPTAPTKYYVLDV
jgi:hypothetical protein